MPELTVSMPAFNSGRYIGAAVESVLRQAETDFELLIGDDGSDDHTVDAVQAFRDPRIRLLRNKKNIGIAACHNLVLEHSDSDVVAHVDSDDLLLAGALQKMVGTLKNDEGLSFAHCNYFFINENGLTVDDRSLQGRIHFLRARTAESDYKRELLIHGGMATNHLRTYRREVFDRVGTFNEKLRYGEDYDMALRIADKLSMRLVPEFLYCRRLHRSNTTQSLRFTGLRMFVNRLAICRELSKSGKIEFTKDREYSVSRLVILRLLEKARRVVF